jgi:hypothetical protein
MSLTKRNTVESVPEQGWQRDPSGALVFHWSSADRLPALDDGVLSGEELPPDPQSGRRGPAETYDWPFGKVVVPSLVAFAAAGLIVAWSLISQPTGGFDLSGFAVACVWIGRAGQVLACLATTALLIAAAQRPRWHRAIALTVWGTFSLQTGFLLLAATQYPGSSCTPRPGWAAITLSDTLPTPTLTVPPGARIIVTVSGWTPSAPLDVTAATGGILREGCSILLPGNGRRTIFAAIKPGTTYIGSTVEPTNLPAPAWGGEVIVRDSRA